MTLRLTETDSAALARLAERDGVSRQEAAVRAIRAADSRRSHEQSVAEAAQWVESRYADVLKRLGE